MMCDICGSSTYGPERRSSKWNGAYLRWRCRSRDCSHHVTTDMDWEIIYLNRNPTKKELEDRKNYFHMSVMSLGKEYKRFMDNPINKVIHLWLGANPSKEWYALGGKAR